MKKLVTAGFLLILVFSVAGCGSKPDHGEEVYRCDSDNLFGFEGVYIDSADTLTIHFEIKNDKSDVAPYYTGMGELLAKGKPGASDAVSIITGDGKQIKPDKENVVLDLQEETISFPLEGCSVSEIRNIHITNGSVIFDMDIVKNTMEVMKMGGEYADYYMQSYNVARAEWSDVVSLGQLFPQTAE